MSAQYPPPGGYSQPVGKTQVLNLDYNLAALLCYLPSCVCLLNLISCILWLVTEPRENRFLRFHALQGLMLLGVALAVTVLFNVLGIGFQLGTQVTTGSEVAGAGAGLLVSLLSWAIGLIILIIHIVAMIKAYQGQMWKLPVIGNIAEKNA
jgi:uncharacterized membrane protein